MTALHAALDGDGPLPLAYLVGRVCEEFGCTPTVAMWEIDNLPVGTIDEILEARYYARAKAQFDAAPTADMVAALPKTEYHAMAIEFTFARERERRHG